jgi:phage terminase large subunit-like protein
MQIKSQSLLPPRPTTPPSRSELAAKLWSASSASSAAALLKELLTELPASYLAELLADWTLWARDDQLPPELDETGEPWRVWLILGGRGAGKTRAGAEWVRAKALGVAPLGRPAAKRIALVGETMAEVRRVMIEGVSGLLAVHGGRQRPRFEPSKMQLVWPDGAIAQMFSAEHPDGLRGPQFDCAWCDEVAKWRHPQKTWDMLQLALRLGRHPQMIATTTPRPIPLLKKLLADAATVVTRAATADNADNLAPTFVAEMTRRYAGSALGRQELLGELVDDTSGALWRRDWIDTHRVEAAPELSAVVVAVDPPVTATAASDACGIVVAGLGPDGRAYVVDDRTLQGREPQVWARAVIAAYREWLADRVVAEVNQGGDLVVAVLRQIDPAVAVRCVRATRGKWLRAEPVAALYAEGRVVHVGTFAALEEQMCAFGADGLARGRSPDRLDALVWALTDLMVGAAGRPGVRRL